MSLFSGLLILTLFFVIFFAAIVAFLFYHKFFRKITVQQSSFANYGFVYQEHIGDYRQNMVVLEDLIRKVNEEKLPVSKAAMIYYDSPRKKNRNDLKSEVGMLLDTPYPGKVNTSLPYKVLKSDHCLQAHFPYVSRFSILFGAMKVYPSFKRHLKKTKNHEGPLIEIYDFKSKKIQYLMPLQ